MKRRHRKYLIKKIGGGWSGRAFIYGKKGVRYIINLPFGISIEFSIIKRVSPKEIDLEMEAQEIYEKTFR